MIRQVTIDKLHEMRLSAMASAFENQCAECATYQDYLLRTVRNAG